MSIDDRTDDRDAVSRLHRLASQAHDAAPDPRVRATVLAAAARAVESRPHAIGSRFPSPVGTRRWPLSAAALVLVSVMTGLVVTRTMQDDPRRVSDGVAAVSEEGPASTSSASVSPAPSPKATGASRAAEPAAPRVSPKAESRFVPPPPIGAAKPKALQTPETAGPSTGVASPVRSVARSDTAPAAPPIVDAEATPVAPVVPAAPAASPSPAPLPRPAMPASPVPPAAAAAPYREDRARLSNGAVASRDANTSGRADGPDASPPSKQGSALLRARNEADPATPQAWLARIAALRAAGRDADADREVDALHARHPSFVIPEEARRAVGP